MTGISDMEGTYVIADDSSAVPVVSDHFEEGHGDGDVLGEAGEPKFGVGRGRQSGGNSARAQSAGTRSGKGTSSSDAKAVRPFGMRTPRVPGHPSTQRSIARSTNAPAGQMPKGRAAPPRDRRAPSEEGERQERKGTAARPVPGSAAGSAASAASTEEPLPSCVSQVPVRRPGLARSDGGVDEVAHVLTFGDSPFPGTHTPEMPGTDGAYPLSASEMMDQDFAQGVVMEPVEAGSLDMMSTTVSCPAESAPGGGHHPGYMSSGGYPTPVTPATMTPATTTPTPTGGGSLGQVGTPVGRFSGHGMPSNVVSGLSVAFSSGGGSIAFSGNGGGGGTIRGCGAGGGAIAEQAGPEEHIDVLLERLNDLVAVASKATARGRSRTQSHAVRASPATGAATSNGCSAGSGLHGNGSLHHAEPPLAEERCDGAEMGSASVPLGGPEATNREQRFDSADLLRVLEALTGSLTESRGAGIIERCGSSSEAAAEVEEREPNSAERPKDEPISLAETLELTRLRLQEQEAEIASMVRDKEKWSNEMRRLTETLQAREEEFQGLSEVTGQLRERNEELERQRNELKVREQQAQNSALGVSISPGRGHSQDGAVHSAHLAHGHIAATSSSSGHLSSTASGVAQAMRSYTGTASPTGGRALSVNSRRPPAPVFAAPQLASPPTPGNGVMRLSSAPTPQRQRVPVVPTVQPPGAAAAMGHRSPSPPPLTERRPSGIGNGCGPCVRSQPEQLSEPAARTSNGVIRLASAPGPPFYGAWPAFATPGVAGVAHAVQPHSISPGRGRCGHEAMPGHPVGHGEQLPQDRFEAMRMATEQAARCAQLSEDQPPPMERTTVTPRRPRCDGGHACGDMLEAAAARGMETVFEASHGHHWRIAHTAPAAAAPGTAGSVTATPPIAAALPGSAQVAAVAAPPGHAGVGNSQPRSCSGSLGGMNGGLTPTQTMSAPAAGSTCAGVPQVPPVVPMSNQVLFHVGQAAARPHAAMPGAAPFQQGLPSVLPPVPAPAPLMWAGMAPPAAAMGMPFPGSAVVPPPVAQ